MRKTSNFLLGLTLSSALCTIASAETPRDVSGVVGDRASAGEVALSDKGYVHVKSRKGSDRVWSNWWNSRKSACLSVVTVNGRYDTITSAPAIDCNQTANSGNGDSDHDQEVAVAIGAAALLGAIALTHDSHHHHNKKHRNNIDHEADFERGHRDGLYGHSYDNYGNSNEYNNGYQSGVNQRNIDSSYRGNNHSYSDYHQNNNYRSHNSHHQSNVRTNDLIGARASSGDDQMRSRGFRNVDGMSSGNTKYTIWYNSDSHQCMQMAIANGRVDSLVDIHRHPKCH